MNRSKPLVRKPFRRKARADGPTAQKEPHPRAELRDVPSMTEEAVAFHTGMSKSGAFTVAAAVKATYGGGTTGPVVKGKALESSAYENAVRDLGYCMRCGWRGRPQFCHRDEGKGVGMKTDVREGWPGCDTCHGWLGGHKGGGRMPKEERRAVELELGQRTRAAVLAAGTWPARLPAWSES